MTPGIQKKFRISLVISACILFFIPVFADEVSEKSVRRDFKIVNQNNFKDWRFFFIEPIEECDGNCDTVWVVPGKINDSGRYGYEIILQAMGPGGKICESPYNLGGTYYTQRFDISLFVDEIKILGIGNEGTISWKFVRSYEIDQKGKKRGLAQPFNGFRIFGIPGSLAITSGVSLLLLFYFFVWRNSLKPGTLHA